MTSPDFLFRGELAEIDPDVAELIRHETARQARYLILIPSESTVPESVREALSSSLHNIYAEGYPLDETRSLTQQEILDYSARLPEYRRYADKRYYKGTEYADIIEALARRRAAELFATPKYKAEQLFVNVQPLSGSPANSAIYSALLNVGDTVMGMDLLHGGHLTHGSPVSRSGRQYKIVSYGIDPATEQLNYEQIRALAQEHKPKMIIAGYTSYPFAPDWQKFREIADSVGAFLMADVSHVAGLIIAGDFPSPVGIADVVSFTTHKTMGGPRGAVLVTHKSALATKLDRAVFPGEQGGPHMNSIAALAVALRLASTEQFRELQHQTVRNANRLSDKLTERGFRVAYGGTNTHMILVDCKHIVGADGTPLSGDMAARILDLAGIVCNRNTIPGDPSALRASGIRLGTPWISQRGFKDAQIDELANIMADLLNACVPFSYIGKKRDEPRAKVDFDALQQAKIRVRELAASIGIDTPVQADDYPHFYYMDGAESAGWTTLGIGGTEAEQFLQAALSNDAASLQIGGQQPTWLLERNGKVISRGILERISETSFALHVEQNANRAAAWLRGLSDGFTVFDDADPGAKVPGPVDVQKLGATQTATLTVSTAGWADGVGYARKAYTIGLPPQELPAFAWEEAISAVKTTTLNALHRSLGAKMVEFAGYDMPVWYSSVTEEHLAVRSGSGIFDVTHMGAFEATGPGAAYFLDLVTTNEVHKLAVGESHYTYFLGADGIPHDDLMIYHIGKDHFLIVVNASNNDKNWAWLNLLKDSYTQTMLPFSLRDLRAESTGAERRVDVALQGPKSKDALLALGASDADKAALGKLAWAGVMRGTFGGFDLIISRTGYTGERIAYELFVHPDQAPALFQALLDKGVKPCGLAARDSLRTEAGLPLYGHELAGALNMNPADAGFGSYVRLWKPYFIGKAAFIAHEKVRDSEIARFRMEAKRVRPPHQGDAIVTRDGKRIGTVTSCSIDSEGFQLGQALIHEDYSADGTLVALQSARAKEGTAPEPAVILSRFPKVKKA